MQHIDQMHLLWCRSTWAHEDRRQNGSTSRYTQKISTLNWHQEDPTRRLLRQQTQNNVRSCKSWDAQHKGKEGYCTHTDIAGYVQCCAQLINSLMNCGWKRRDFRHVFHTNPRESHLPFEHGQKLFAGTRSMPPDVTLQLLLWRTNPHPSQAARSGWQDSERRTPEIAEAAGAAVVTAANAASSGKSKKRKHKSSKHKRQTKKGKNSSSDESDSTETSTNE